MIKDGAKKKEKKNISVKRERPPLERDPRQRSAANNPSKEKEEEKKEYRAKYIKTGLH